MHPTHEPFHLTDGDLACKRCHICNCHSPELAAEVCEFADQTERHEQ